jgi:tellurite resistance protein TerC
MTIQHPYFIGGFCITILLMLVLDLGIFNRKPHQVSSREAIIWSIVWIGMSMIFSFLLWYYTGFETFTKFQSAYWIEKALSVDNLFVFILVFNFFKVPKEYHHKVLFWGIIGAITLRGLFIFSGVALIQMTYLPDFIFMDMKLRINLILSIFGLILIFAGIKSALPEKREEIRDFKKSPGAKIIYRLFKVSDSYDGPKFFTVQNGIRIATPLLVVTGVMEFTDLIFAVDSIPAVFAIAPDEPFILYTSNIFAILGLRSLYFLLANFIDRFSLLKYGLAIILVFIGTKMLLAPVWHIPSPLSLSVVGGVLVIFTCLSLLIKPSKEE